MLLHLPSPTRYTQYTIHDTQQKMAAADRHRSTLIVSTLTVVMASILGVGGLTKPLLATLLADGGDSALAAQLSTVPLLG